MALAQTCATSAAAGTEQLWAALWSLCAGHRIPHRVPNVPLPTEWQETGFNILPLAGRTEKSMESAHRKKGRMTQRKEPCGLGWVGDLEKVEDSHILTSSTGC